MKHVGNATQFLSGVLHTACLYVSADFRLLLPVQPLHQLKQLYTSITDFANL